MTRSAKIASRALALTLAAAALVACAPYYYDNGYYYGDGYGRGYYGSGYDRYDGYGGYNGYDGYGGYGYAGYDGCYGGYPPEYCGYPTFSGSVVIGGRQYRGLRYRDGRNGRQYWYGGGW